METQPGRASFVRRGTAVAVLVVGGVVMSIGVGVFLIERRAAVVDVRTALGRLDHEVADLRAEVFAERDPGVCPPTKTIRYARGEQDGY